jgi:subfamily B ATP-binding cassette protein MsbA
MQRIAIARALLRDPRILILDEPTSALDSETEACVMSALERAGKGRTTFIIAHRLSTVRNADRLIVLDAGRIVQEGTFESLHAEIGLFRRLVDAHRLFDPQDEGGEPFR